MTTATPSHQDLLRLAALLRARHPAHEHFNVFKALQIETDEARLHSRLIAFLVNPRAHAHGAGLLYRFMQAVGITACSMEECRHARVVTEEGRIDILVEFGRTRAVVIENKIYAPDQAGQLRRYWEQVRRHHDDVHVLYLTLQGDVPAPDSLGDLDVRLQDRYQNISYRHHIRQWLHHAEASAVREPHLRETIAQYAAVVDRLTGNLETKEYMNDLVDLLLSADHLRQARDIRAAYTGALVRLQERMWDELLGTAAREYPAMAQCLNGESLSLDPDERRARIERFYQPNARFRNYFGLYFDVPGFSHVCSIIELDAGLYTGVYCPEGQKRERRRAVAALASAGIRGDATPSLPLWRRCALSSDLHEPDPMTLEVLGKPELLREAARASMAQVFAAWSALQGA